MLDRFSDGDSDESSINEDDIFLSTQRPILGELIWKGKSFPLYDGDNLIGRDNVCEVKIDHKSLSGKHAEILIAGSGSSSNCILRDLRSTNGTFLEYPKGSDKYQKLSVLNNGKLLEDGGKVRFGMISCSFRFVNNSCTIGQKGDQSEKVSSSSLKSHHMEETQLLNDVTLVDEDEDNALEEGRHVDDDTVTEGDDFEVHTKPIQSNDEETVTEVDGNGNGDYDDDALVDVIPPGMTFVRVDGSTSFLHPTGSAQLPTQIDDDDLDDLNQSILPPVEEGTEVEESGNEEDETMSQDLMEPITEPEVLPLSFGTISPQPPPATSVSMTSAWTEEIRSSSKSVSNRKSFLDDTDTEEEGEGISGHMQPVPPVSVVRLEPNPTHHQSNLQSLADPVDSDVGEGDHPSSAGLARKEEPTAVEESTLRKSGRARKSNVKFTNSTDERYQKKIQEEMEGNLNVSTTASTPRKRKGKETSDEEVVPIVTEPLPKTLGRGRGRPRNQSAPAQLEESPVDEVVPKIDVSPKSSDVKVLEVPPLDGVQPLADEESVSVRGKAGQKSITPSIVHIPLVSPGDASSLSNSRKKRRPDDVELSGRGSSAPPIAAALTNEEDDTTRVVKRSKSGLNSNNTLLQISNDLILENSKGEPSSTVSKGRGIGESSTKTEPSTESVPTNHIITELALPIRILFTKVEESAYTKHLKKIPNVEVTSDARIATHCITTKELKRTPKLMVALNSSILFIINEQWIVDSAKAGKPLPIVQRNRISSASDREEYLSELKTSPYVIHDIEKEQLWSFDLSETLTQIRCNLSSSGERQGVGVFTNIAVFCTKGLCGSKAPSEEEMQQIVESGNGIWLRSLTEFTNIGNNDGSNKKKGSKSKSQEISPEGKIGRILVVISHEALVKKEVKKDILDIAKASGGKGIYSIELIFQAVLRQDLNLHGNILEGYSF